MTENIDYELYAYLDDIDIAGGVGLLNNIDTLRFKEHVRIQPIELDYTGELRKQYHIMRSVQWHQIYQSAKFYTKNIVHPYMFIIEALNRKLADTENQFYKAVNNRYRSEFGTDIINDEHCHFRKCVSSDKLVTNDTLYKFAAAMATIYMELYKEKINKNFSNGKLQDKILERFPDVRGLGEKNIQKILSVAADAIPK